MRNAILALVGLLLLGACSQTPEFTAANERCEIIRYSLETPLPDETPLSSIVDENLGSMLFLSGGSQNGAFGAGFIDGWHSTGRMPQFSLVTGISTGALQATGAFIGRPEITVDGYTIDNEAELLDTFVSGSQVSDGPSFSAIRTALRRGAFADLVGLRSVLDRIYTPDVLAAVATRYRHDGSGAYLLVGATDYDLGHAVAFDMTELAHRYSLAPEGGDLKRRLKSCYIEALVASSVVPGAARPVAIDNRLYVDGGLRYAVFDDRIGRVLRNSAKMAGPEAIMPSLYMILNSDGEPKRRCGKVDETNCDPLTSTIGQREDWNLIGLALRSVDLLVDQVHRLSIQRATERAQEFAGQSYFARIRAADLGPQGEAFAITDFDGSKTCNAWRSEDDATDNPVEFHKRFMRCLIEYGRKRGQAADWDFGGREL